MRGDKTQTRRVIPVYRYGIDFVGGSGDDQDDPRNWGVETERDGWCMLHEPDPESGFSFQLPCKYGQPGDLLYVRESWAALDAVVGGYDRDPPQCIGYPADGSAAYFRDDGTSFSPDMYGWDDWPTRPIKRRPSIFLPKWASRIWLRVTDVRVERVQDISEEGAVAEGVESRLRLVPDSGGDREVREAAVDVFRHLWDRINAKRGYGWDTNPWVWVVTFEPVSFTGRAGVKDAA